MSRTLSPLSIPYRVLQRGGGIVVGIAFVLFSGGSLPGMETAAPLLFLGALVAAGALIGYEVAYVRRFSYELAGDTLDIDSGVLSRRSREIPLRRVQNVDISRNVFQRLLGIAVVSFETAGGGETEAELRFVSYTEAKRLQRELGRLKRGDAASAGTEAEARETSGEDVVDDVATDTGPEQSELFALGRSELALLAVFSIDLRVPGILFVLVSTAGSAVVSNFLSTVSGLLFVLGGVLIVVGVVLLSWVVGAAAAIVNYYDFRLVRSGEELQYERGLLQRYDGSIPFEKVQTLTIADNPLKRYFGYASLYIETAGYAPGSGGSSRGSEAAIPIADRERILDLVEELEPVGDVDFRRPPKRARERYVIRYLLVIAVLTAGLYAADAFLGVQIPWWPPLVLVPFAIAFAHANWKHRGHWLGEYHAVTRNGVLRRETKIVPYYRIQTVIDSRNVFQRRRNLATVAIDTAGSLSLGGKDAAAVDIADERADELLTELEARLKRAVDAFRAGRAGVGIADPEEDSPAETPEEYGPAETPEEDSPAETPEEDSPAETPEEDSPAETPEEDSPAETPENDGDAGDAKQEPPQSDDGTEAPLDDESSNRDQTTDGRDDPGD
ncbi:PH domain-containing protein [Halobellus ordinarius]|uniref:PH domain-containing protein n=1 Tax=Halobellus ordinarius TaxID=3075120 RepID=UPI002880A9B4|nr:PH domain-containing protein [Halobellus sp. ZY16]